MTQEQQRRAQAWLASRVTKHRCEACSGGPWVMLGVVDTPARARVTRFTQGYGVPALLVACKNCGYMRQFAAAMMGLVGDPEVELEPLKRERTASPINAVMAEEMAPTAAAAAP